MAISHYVMHPLILFSPSIIRSPNSIWGLVRKRRFSFRRNFLASKRKGQKSGTMYFLLSNLIDSMYLGQIKGRLKCLALKKQFLANQNLAILPDTKHNTFCMKIYSRPWLFSLSTYFHIRFMLACKQKL